MARRWGNCDAGARTLDETETAIEGVFIDYETGFRLHRPVTVAKVKRAKRGKGGGVWVLDEAQLAKERQAGYSKAMRNAILAGLPAYLKAAYEKKARVLVAGGNLDAKATPKDIQHVLTTFLRRWPTITQAALEAYVEQPAAEWTGEQIADLRGLYAALVDGQTTVEEAFPPKEAPEGRPEPTPVDLSGAEVTAADGQDPGRQGSAGASQGSLV